MLPTSIFSLTKTKMCQCNKIMLAHHTFTHRFFYVARNNYRQKTKILVTILNSTSFSFTFLHFFSFPLFFLDVKHKTVHTYNFFLIIHFFSLSIIQRINHTIIFSLIILSFFHFIFRRLQ